MDWVFYGAWESLDSSSFMAKEEFWVIDMTILTFFITSFRPYTVEKVHKTAICARTMKTKLIIMMVDNYRIYLDSPFHQNDHSFKNCQVNDEFDE